MQLAAFGQVTGQGWEQVGELALAFVLSALMGLEREARQKSAGLRTHTLVGVGAALFMLVSKYGFGDVLSANRVVLDPSRVAAQIVSGIGFIGGGLIFVRRDAVRGLTTAAVVWLTAAVGAAAGAGLPVLAVAGTAGHFIVVYGLTPLARLLPGSRTVPSRLQLRYEGGAGVLRSVLAEITRRKFMVADTNVEREEPDDGTGRRKTLIGVTLQIVGTGHTADLVAAIGNLPGVVSVSAGDVNVATEP